jgi:Protein of unknown function (DUF4231)
VTIARPIDEREAAALRRCEDQIRWYERHSTRSWRWFALVQTAAVLLAASTPILILWSSVPKAVQALPAALASVAAGLGGTFRWLQNKSRWAYAAEALKSERVFYERRASPHYGPEVWEEEALSAFVRRIEEVSMAEVSEWQSDLSRLASSDTGRSTGPRDRPSASSDS